jgi:predicted PurR-regulated permease PerM
VAFPDRRTANILLTILLFAGVCALIYSARRILLIFIFAILFAYLIDPVVKFLQRRSLFFRNLRGPAVLEVYLAFIILIAVSGYGLAPGVVRNAGKLIDEIPVLLDGLSTGEIATNLGGKYGWSDAQEYRFKAFLTRHREDVQSLVRGVDRYLSNAAEVLAWLLLIPLLAIFFLRDGEHIADVLIRVIFPANRCKEVRAIADQLHIMLTKYIRAQVLLCGLSFLFYSAVLLLFKFPHAIALGMLGGVLEFIPAVGWMSTAAAIIGVGIVNHSHWIWVAALLGVWRIAQNYFTSPSIMGRHLEIHPLAAIFALLVGAEVGGIVGIYLAVPVVASLRVIWQAYAGPEREGSACRDLDVTSRAPSSLAETAVG